MYFAVPQFSDKVHHTQWGRVAGSIVSMLVASSIKDLFDSTEAHKNIDFIKETRFYKQL